VHPYDVGTLPYAIVENFERLVEAFAEFRQSPRDERVRAKILYTAGYLSHHTADAAQPLHTTIHFDGRADKRGKSPRTGIHKKVDALPGRLGIEPSEAAKGLRASSVKDVFAETLKIIRDSHSRVDRVYELERALPETEGPMPAKPDRRVAGLARERVRAGARFTATVWYTAWVRSSEIELPPWRRTR